MLERFLVAYTATTGPELESLPTTARLSDLLEFAGGRTFEHGLYRIHTRSSAKAADALVRNAYPEFADRLSCFGYDWLGRQFATDTGRGALDDPEVALFEPGTALMLEIPAPFSRFHDEVLIELSEAALAHSFFDEWLRAGGAAPASSECIGYKLPLYLGGDDTIDNLELSDLDVYWTIMGQLRRRVKGFPEGTVIDQVTGDR